MHKIDFYCHEGCLSQQSILLLAQVVQHECPSWHIECHSLSHEKAKTIGLHILPAVVMNDATLAVGLPQIDWLLEKMREYERAYHR